MNNVKAFIVINGVFLSVNVVAAGVFRVLGELVRDLVPDADLTVWPWLLVGMASIGASVIFLMGFVDAGKSLAKKIGYRP
jgi:hypothetical protein